MIVSAAIGYRQAARRVLPRFLPDYLDGGSYAEMSLRSDFSDLSSLALRESAQDRGRLPGEGSVTQAVD